jgi:hypothetical protein
MTTSTPETSWQTGTPAVCSTDLFGVPIVETRQMAAEGGEQAIYTPDELAVVIVNHFKPAGRLCEPCKGGGSFLRAMPGADWYEITEGRDFLKAQGQWDWIVTNPPWELVAEFLEKSMQCADNIVILCWLAALYTKARQRMIREAGFGMVEMLYVPTPLPPWPQSGFQLAAMWLRRGWTGGVQISTPNDQAHT